MRIWKAKTLRPADSLNVNELLPCQNYSASKECPKDKLKTLWQLVWNKSGKWKYSFKMKEILDFNVSWNSPQEF